jgi:hypothetical protein
MRKNQKLFSIALVAALAAMLLGGCDVIGATKSGATPAAPASAGTSAAPASLLPTASPAASLAPTPTPEPTLPPMSILTVTAGRITLSDDYVTVDAAFPIVSGMMDEGFQAALNAGMRSQVEDIVMHLHADAQASFAETPAGEFVKYMFEATMVVYKNDATVLSLGVRMERYTGGAHTELLSQFYTLLNTSQGRQLKLPDLFTDPAAGVSRVTAAVQAKIALSPDDYYSDPLEAVSEGTEYYIMGEDLHIVYPAYAIAASAMGEPDFALPLADFSDILIAEIPH